jgi:hypothetical protein
MAEMEYKNGTLYANKFGVSDVAEITYIDNPEFLSVTIDNDGRILEAIKKDGSEVHPDVSPEKVIPVLLWAGSSITEGCTYPINASKKLGCEGINNGVGGSGLAVDWNEQVYSNGFSTIAEYVASQGGYGPYRNCAESIAEKEHRQELYNYPDWDTYKDMILGYSYENLITKYIKQFGSQSVGRKANFFISDYGINDRHIIRNQLIDIIKSHYPDWNWDDRDGTGVNVKTRSDITKGMIDEITVSDIDWSSRDRATFPGAYGYLLDRIWEIDPFFPVIQISYFENNNLADTPSGAYVCKMQELCCEHYQIPFVRAFEQTHMTHDWAVGSKEYAEEMALKYGTDYRWAPRNEDGDLQFFWLMNPDSIHCFSDRSNRTNKMLDSIIANMMKKYIIDII